MKYTWNVQWMHISIHHATNICFVRIVFLLRVLNRETRSLICENPNLILLGPWSATGITTFWGCSQFYAWYGTRACVQEALISLENTSINSYYVTQPYMLWQHQSYILVCCIHGVVQAIYIYIYIIYNMMHPWQSQAMYIYGASMVPLTTFQCIYHLWDRVLYTAY